MKIKSLRHLFVLLLLKVDVLLYIFGREKKKNSLAAFVLLKIRGDCALLLLLTAAVKNNVSDMEPKQNVFFPES